MTAAPHQFPVLNPPSAGAYVSPEGLLRRFTIRDIGSDVQQRFGYQAACVALYAIVSLLDDDPKYIAVYCEVLEDFLLQHLDGTYAAVQVKTREKNRVPFKTSDEEMLSTLFRFGDYEHQEGHNFHRYVIATNAGFWKEKRTWHNLNHVRQAAASSSPMSNTDIALLNSEILAAGPSDTTIDCAILASVFRKLELDNELPALGAERDALRSALVRHLGNPTIREIDFIVSDLIAFVREHSDRSHEDRHGVRRVLSSDPEKADREMRVASRRITSDSLRARLTNAAEGARLFETMRMSITGWPKESTEPSERAFRYTGTPEIQQTSDGATLKTAGARAARKAAATTDPIPETQDLSAHEALDMGAGSQRLSHDRAPWDVAPSTTLGNDMGQRESDE